MLPSIRRIGIVIQFLGKETFCLARRLRELESGMGTLAKDRNHLL